MNTKLKTPTAAAALIAGIISASAVYAHGPSESPESTMGQGGMMGQGDMNQGGMMGMMNMMGQMNQMMNTCNTMMQHKQEDLQKLGQTPKKNEG